MRRVITVIGLVLALALPAAVPVRAQQPAMPPEGGAGTTEVSSVENSEAYKTDKTGTNPLNLQTTLDIFNQLQARISRRYMNITNFRWISPFASSTASFRFTLPVVLTDIGGTGDFGFGDFNFRVNYIPLLTRKNGLALSLETQWNTASAATLGTGRNLIAPSVLYAWFLPANVIFAPAYQQFFDIGGNSSRSALNYGTLDFYLAKTDKDGWWLLDPLITFNYGHSNVFGQIELERGFTIGRVGRGEASWYLRPGIGMGDGRTYNWMIELGYRIVGL